MRIVSRYMYNMLLNMLFEKLEVKLKDNFQYL